MTLASRLRDLRMRKSLSQKQLAAATGISQPRLSRLERGKTRDPKRSVLQLLADVLTAGSIDGLIQDDREEDKPSNDRPLC